MKLRKILRSVLALGGVLVLALAIALAWAWGSGRLVHTVYHDADGNSLRGETIRVRRVLWSAPAAAEPAKVDAARVEGILASDGAERILVLALPTERGDHDLFYRIRSSSGWSPPEPFGEPVSSPSDDVSPALSRDGERLYFASDRAGGLGGLDLWVSVRIDGEWTRPRNLGPSINSPWDDRSPAPHPWASILLFASNRPHGFLVTPPDDWRDVPTERWTKSTFAIAVATGEERAGKLLWSHPSRVAEIASDAGDDWPAFSLDGKLLYFASARAGGSGGLDLYRCRVVRPLPGMADPIDPPLLVAAPEPLGAPVNSSADERSPRIFDRGFALVCERETREGEPAILLETHTVEVEEELELATLPIEALAAHAGQITLLATSSIAMLVAIVVLWRTRRRWTADLLVRCGVVAVLAHIGLLYGFYFWRIGSEILAFAREERDIEVALETVAGTSIDFAVRAQVLDVPEPVAASPALNPSSVRDPDEMLAPRVPSSRAMTPAATPAPPVRGATLPRRDVEPREVEVARLVAEARPVEPLAPAATSLPESAVLPPSPSEEIDSPPDASVRVDLDPTRTTSAETAHVLARSVTTPVSEAATPELATSAVIGPEPRPLLPASARTSSNESPEKAPLPIPAQSPRAETREELVPQAMAEADRTSAVTVAVAAEALRPGPSARLAEPLGRWESRQSALEPTVSIDDAPADLPEAPAPVPARTLPVRSTRVELPEPVPLAERSRAGEGRESPDAPRETTSEQRDIVAVAIAPAMLRSEAARSEAAPVTASPPIAAVLEEAALARPAPSSSPGTLRPRVERADLDPVETARPALPEAASGERAADLVGEGGPSSTGRAVAAAETARELLPDTPVPVRPPAPREGPSEPERGTRTAASDLASALLADDPLARPSSSSPASAAEVLAPPSVSAVRIEPGASTLKAVAATRRLPELPEGTSATPRLVELRRPESRRELLERMGGTAASEAAVVRALEWLAREQHADGHWDAISGGGSLGEVDAAITGLAVLCFLGHGHVPGTRERWAADVERAIDWLLATQSESGVLSGRDRQYTMYTHAIATLALSEAFLMTDDRRLYAPLERAAAIIVQSQNPRTGGWRYQPEPPLRGDTSITGWQVLALTSVQSAGISVPAEVFDRARRWFDIEAGGGKQGGIYGYRGKEEPRVSMAAEGMYARLLLGAERGFPPIEEAARYLYTETHDGTHLNNLYLLYYGTLGLYQYQGWIWEAWNTQVRDFLIREQRQDGANAGSWDPLDEYVETGGRVLATAFATLTLEVYYRYLPLYWGKD